MGYLCKHNLLYNLQFGFMHCLHAILIIINSLLEARVDSGGVPKHTIAVFLGLKKGIWYCWPYHIAEKIGEYGSGVQGVGMVQALPVLLNGVSSNETTM